MLNKLKKINFWTLLGHFKPNFQTCQRLNVNKKTLLMDGSAQTKLESGQDTPKQVLIKTKPKSKMIKFKFLTLFQKNDQK